MSSEISNDDLDAWLRKVSRFEDQDARLQARNLRLSDLKMFLTHLQGNLSSAKPHMKLSGILKKFPRVGQFLGCLCNCNDVILNDELYQLVMQCVLLLSVQNPTNVLEQKATAWARAQIRQTVSYYKQKDPCSTLAHSVGCYPDHYNSESCRKLIEHISDRLLNTPRQAWETKTGLMLPCRPLPSDTVSMLSLQCLPLLKVPCANHVIEALLSCHSSAGDAEPLHPAFLEAILDSQCNAYSKVSCDITLSYECCIALWDKYLPALEKEVVMMVKALTSHQPWLPREEAMKLINTRHLPLACVEHLAIYRVVDNLLRAFLESTHGNPDILRIMDILSQALLHCTDDTSKLKALPSICSLYPLKYQSLVNLLILSPQELSVQSCCLQLSHIDTILKDILNTSFSQNSKADIFELWLVLVRWPTWYYKAVEMVLMADWSHKPPGITLMCWFNYPLHSEKHLIFKEMLTSLGGTFRQLIHKPNLKTEDFKHVAQLANQNPEFSQVTNVLQPMCQLFVIYSKIGLQNLQCIVALALSSNAINSPMCELRFVLDAIELFSQLNGSSKSVSNCELLVETLQALKKASLADLLAGGDCNRATVRHETDQILLCCGYAEQQLQRTLSSSGQKYR